MRFNNKIDKGVAGLTILLSFVVVLFIIGLLVMIFSLMGGGLQDATYDETTASVTNETLVWDGDGISTLATAGALNFASWNASQILNGSVGGVMTNETLVEGTDYTIFSGNGSLVNVTGGATGVRITYTYTYDATNTATEVMNDTTVGIANVTDWFDIFIVIMAMVVLILLTVIIISAIRGSGLMAGGSA